MNKRKTFLTLGLTAVVAGGLLFTNGVFAADHGEAPGAGADPAADIADFYTWHTEDSVVGRDHVRGRRCRCARCTTPRPLYTIHIDTDFDQVSDFDIHARFGEDADGNWGVQFTGLPGADGVVEGAVDEALDGGGGGDGPGPGPPTTPFFFDLQGFQDTLGSGLISFTATDFFAGLNVTAVVVEFPTAELGSTTFQTWATTGRL